MNHFYRDRPASEQERLDMIEFFQEERRLDELNALEFENMDKSHLGKGKLRSFEAATKRWAKDTAKNIRDTSKAAVFQHNQPRTWIISVTQ